MRAMSFYLADFALRVSERSERPVPEPFDAGAIWTPERAAAWRAWASRESSAERAPGTTARAGFSARLEAPSRPAVVETARVARQSSRGGWLQLILREREPARR